MILHRLLEALFDNGVGFVTTSNFQPDDLYPNGLHRDRILPAIALLKRASWRCISVDNGTDYRRRTLEQVQAVPHAARARGRRRDERGLRRAWPRRATRTRCCTSSTREIRARRKAGGVVWFDFRTLCGGPRSQNDYLEIATQFHTVLLSRRAAHAGAHGLAKRGASPGWSTCCTTAASS